MCEALPPTLEQSAKEDFHKPCTFHPGCGAGQRTGSATHAAKVITGLRWRLRGATCVTKSSHRRISPTNNGTRLLQPNGNARSAVMPQWRPCRGDSGPVSNTIARKFCRRTCSLCGWMIKGRRPKTTRSCATSALWKPNVPGRRCLAATGRTFKGHDEYRFRKDPVLFRCTIQSIDDCQWRQLQKRFASRNGTSMCTTEGTPLYGIQSAAKEFSGKSGRADMNVEVIISEKAMNQILILCSVLATYVQVWVPATYIQVYVYIFVCMSRCLQAIMLFFIDSSWFWSGDILSQLCDYGQGSMLPDCSFSHLCRGLGIGLSSRFHGFVRGGFWVSCVTMAKGQCCQTVPSVIHVSCEDMWNLIRYTLKTI